MLNRVGRRAVVRLRVPLSRFQRYYGTSRHLFLRDAFIEQDADVSAFRKAWAKHVDPADGTHHARPVWGDVLEPIRAQRPQGKRDGRQPRRIPGFNTGHLNAKFSGPGRRARRGAQLLAKFSNRRASSEPDARHGNESFPGKQACATAPAAPEAAHAGGGRN